MKNTIKIALFTLALLLASKNMAFAGSSACQIIYGGGEICPPQVSFSIEKQVFKPGKGGEFVNNLTVNDPKFSPEETVPFKIIVTNTGTNDIANLEVTDTFPEFVNFASGVGNFDSNTKTLRFIIGSLAAGQSMEFFINGRVAGSNQLPKDRQVVCVVNKVRGIVDGVTADSFSQLCIEKRIVIEPTIPLKVFQAPKAKVTPETGPEMWPLIGIIPSGILGYFLRRKKLS